MANSEAGTSSDAAQAPVGEYQVFLSFRGADIRYSFSDFLYDRLVDAGVDVFRDEERLRYGDVLSEKLVYAINNSILYIPIFSENYAESKWCLDELALMVDNVSNSEGQKSIFPVFFHVTTDDIKLKRSSRYKAALEKHMKKYSDIVAGWKEALQLVGEHSGCVMKKDQSQAVYVKLIVNRVLEMLEIKQKLGVEHLVGLENRVKHLTKSLDVNRCDVWLLVIYGIGGIGKTTIAKAVFDQLSANFRKRCSFLKDVRKSSSTKEGIVQLQKRLLYDIVDSECAENVKDDEDGTQTIGRTLPTKKVLVGLDDVHDKELIKILIGYSSLCLGSRIIITTRNMDILKVEGIGEIHEYDMPKMNENRALELFCHHAFGTKSPPDDFDRRSREIVPWMRGLPLTIKVIGSLLKGEEDRDFWKETLEKLSEGPEEEILKALRISYDDLEDYQKEIFLDIACFFVNEKKTDAIYMWTGPRVYPIRAINVLTKGCLIKILDNDEFWMHDEIIELGRQIVREDSQDDPRNQTRLWIAEEALKIMKTEERNDKVEALVIDGPNDSIEITNIEFERLPNLKFLKLRNGTFSGNFTECCSKLKWISWHPPQQDFGAENMYLDHLVVFKLDRNVFKDDSRAWDLIKSAQNLKVLSLIECRGITKIPVFPQSLINLEIEGCQSLTDLSEEVRALVKLERLSLFRSSSELRKLPNSIVELISLRVLRFPQTASFRGHENWSLPNGINMLKNLEELDLSGHYELGGEIPNGIGELSSLKILNLAKTSIHKIPPTINGLHHLQTLNLFGCHEIPELPELPTSLTCLVLQSISLLLVPNLSNLTNLVELELSDGSQVTKESKLNAGCTLSWIERLSRLKKLDLNLQNVLVPPELASLSHLEELSLSRLDLETLVLPCSLTSLNLEFYSIRWAGSFSTHLRLRNLSTLLFYYGEVEDIPLDGLPQLENLRINGCKRLKRLSIPWELRNLQEVYVSNCHKLVEIQVVDFFKPLESLRYLVVHSCQSLRRIGGLSYLKNLEKLVISVCYGVTNVEGLNELNSLISLEVTDCPLLRILIDAFCTNIPDYCLIHILGCGDSIKNAWRISLESYRKFIPLDPSNEINHPFTIIFVLGVKKYNEGYGFIGGEEREKENATLDSVTYEGLIADVNGFGFHLERMWYKAPSEDGISLVEIKSDEEVNGMVPLASRRGCVHLYVEGKLVAELSTAECSEAAANGTQTRDRIIMSLSSIISLCCNRHN